MTPLLSLQLSCSSQSKVARSPAMPRRHKKAPTPGNNNEALMLLTLQQQVLQLTEARATLANVLTLVRETPLHDFTSAQDRRTLSTAQSCLDLVSDLRLMPTQSKKQSNRSNWHSCCVKDKQRGKFIILTCPHLLSKKCLGESERGCAVASQFHLVRCFTP